MKILLMVLFMISGTTKAEDTLEEYIEKQPIPTNYCNGKRVPINECPEKMKRWYDHLDKLKEEWTRNPRKSFSALVGADVASGSVVAELELKFPKKFGLFSGTEDDSPDNMFVFDTNIKARKVDVSNYAYMNLDALGLSLLGHAGRFGRFTINDLSFLRASVAATGAGKKQDDRGAYDDLDGGFNNHIRFYNLDMQIEGTPICRIKMSSGILVVATSEGSAGNIKHEGLLCLGLNIGNILKLENETAIDIFTTPNGLIGAIDDGFFIFSNGTSAKVNLAADNSHRDFYLEAKGSYININGESGFNATAGVSTQW